MDQELIDLLEVVKELPLANQEILIGDVRHAIKSYRPEAGSEFQEALKVFEWKYGAVGEL